MSDDKPFRIWVRKVDSQHRIRLNPDLIEALVWAPAEPGSSIPCFAFPGPHGQLQFAQRVPEYEFREKLAAELSQRPARVDEAATEWVQFARYAAMWWPVTLIFDAEPQRFAITLPKEARDLRLTPKAGEIALIFGTGNILEIWNEQSWETHSQIVARDPAAFAARAAAAMEDR